MKLFGFLEPASSLALLKFFRPLFGQQLRSKAPYPNAVPDDLHERITALRPCLEQATFTTSPGDSG